MNTRRVQQGTAILELREDYSTLYKHMHAFVVVSTSSPFHWTLRSSSYTEKDEIEGTQCLRDSAFSADKSSVVETD